MTTDWLTRTVEQRFWQKVTKTADCWLWTAYTDRHGYGQFNLGRQRGYAHRVSYEWAHGPIPSGLVLDHLCRTPSCVNPDHLEPVTQRVNILRGESPSAKQARQTHCQNGHEFTPENTMRGGPGRRRCRECDRVRQARLVPCPDCGQEMRRTGFGRHRRSMHADLAIWGDRGGLA